MSANKTAMEIVSGCAPVALEGWPALVDWLLPSTPGRIIESAAFYGPAPGADGDDCSVVGTAGPDRHDKSVVHWFRRGRVWRAWVVDRIETVPLRVYPFAGAGVTMILYRDFYGIGDGAYVAVLLYMDDYHRSEHFLADGSNLVSNYDPPGVVRCRHNCLIAAGFSLPLQPMVVVPFCDAYRGPLQCKCHRCVPQSYWPRRTRPGSGTAQQRTLTMFLCMAACGNTSRKKWGHYQLLPAVPTEIAAEVVKMTFARTRVAVSAISAGAGAACGFGL